MTNAFAAENIICRNSEFPELSYKISSNNLEDYSLRVFSKGQIIYRDVLEGLDYQGALVLESKKTYMNLEDMDNVTYTYTKLINGTFRTVSETLTCELL